MDIASFKTEFLHEICITVVIKPSLQITLAKKGLCCIIIMVLLKTLDFYLTKILYDMLPLNNNLCLNETIIITI